MNFFPQDAPPPSLTNAIASPRLPALRFIAAHYDDSKIIVGGGRVPVYCGMQ